MPAMWWPSSARRRLACIAAQCTASADVPALCIVTGGSTGIGAAVCAQLAGRGYRVFSVARRPCEMEGIQSIELDLSSGSSVDVVAQEVHKELSGGQARVHLIHCASNYPSDSARSVDKAGLEQALILNVTTPALLTSRLVPYMSTGSSIVFVGSTLSEKSVPNKLSYCSAKHAMTGLMRAVAQDLLWSGINVALVCPGITDTPMVRNAIAGQEERFSTFVSWPAPSRVRLNAPHGNCMPRRLQRISKESSVN